MSLIFKPDCLLCQQQFIERHMENQAVLDSQKRILADCERRISDAEKMMGGMERDLAHSPIKDVAFISRARDSIEVMRSRESPKQEPERRLSGEKRIPGNCWEWILYPFQKVFQCFKKIFLAIWELITHEDFS